MDHKIKNEKGDIICTIKAKTLREAVEKAIAEGVDLSGADFSGASLERVNLTNGKLTAAKFEGAILHGANLSNANLRRAKFYDTVLQYANFGNADLTWAKFNNADLAYTNFSNSVLCCAVMEEIDLYGSNLVKLDKTGATHNYEILVTPTHFKIGCRFFSIREWLSFDDEIIADMDPFSKPLDFWQTWKSILKQIAIANGYSENNKNKEG